MRKVFSALLLLCSFSIFADVNIRGGGALDQDSATMAGVWLTQDGCRDCLALNGGVIRGDEHGNLFAGADWPRKLLDNGEFVLRPSLGLAFFEKPLHGVGQKLNFHLGLALEFPKALGFSGMGVYFDHYSNGRRFFNHNMTTTQNPPRNMISVGMSF